MPPKHHSQTLNSLRQELRNRLIKIGMQIDPEPELEEKNKILKKVRGKTEEDENLPMLQPFKNNKIFLQDFKKVLN